MPETAVQPQQRSGLRALLSLARSFFGFAGQTGVAAIVYVALGAIFESVGILLIVPLLTIVIGGTVHGRWLEPATAALFATAGATTPFGRLAVLMAGFAVLMVLRAVVVTLRDSTVMALQFGYVDHLRMAVTEALAAAGWERVLRLRHARILNLMSGDLARISGSIHFFLQIGIAVALLAAQCILSFWLSVRLALFSLALLGFGALLMRPVLRRGREMGRYMTAVGQWVMDSTGQFLGGLKLALSQELQTSFVAEMRSSLSELRNRQNAFMRQQNIGRTALTTVSALVGAAVVLLGYGAFGLSPPVLIAFLIVIGRMSGPANQIQQGLQQLAQGLPAYEAVCDLLAELDAPRRLEAHGGPGAAIDWSRPIVLSHVSYQHVPMSGERSHGIRDIALTIGSGEVLGLAGSSGAGKSTLADILVGLIEPQAGQVEIGERILDAESRRAWREQISYVSQDPFLFHDTVRRNLLWACPDASEAEMWNALGIAGAETMVRGMEHGLDTVVGERGTLVSGGERQRIALARALLRRSRLLVLDEATNAIDVGGERQLFERLLALSPRPTIVLIAHRNETLALCDRIVHLENGRIAEDATA